MSAETKWVRIERSFDASIERVWRLWTEPDLFKTWYGPNGATIPVAEMDLVVGGRRKICLQMETPGKTMTLWFVGEFREISAPTRLVYTESMSDADGVALPPERLGMPDDHPTVTEIIVDLSERDGKTHMTLTHIGVPADSGGAGGWAQAVDKLAALADAA